VNVTLRGGGIAPLARCEKADERFIKILQERELLRKRSTVSERNSPDLYTLSNPPFIKEM
jgi:hypothetical protein